MENHSYFNTIGQQMIDNRIKRKERLEKRLEEVEDWILDNPYTHPEFQKYVEERNHINTQLNIK